MMKQLALAAILAAGAVDLAAAQAQRNLCRVQPIRFCDGCTVSRNILVGAGSTCLFNSTSSGGAFLGYDVVVRPRLGTFGMASVSQAAYRAGAQIGPDYFEYRIRWERYGRPTFTTIRNRVRVVAPPRGAAPPIRRF